MTANVRFSTAASPASACAATSLSAPNHCSRIHILSDFFLQQTIKHCALLLNRNVTDTSADCIHCWRNRFYPCPVQCTSFYDDDECGAVCEPDQAKEPSEKSSAINDLILCGALFVSSRRRLSCIGSRFQLYANCAAMSSMHL